MKKLIFLLIISVLTKAVYAQTLVVDQCNNMPCPSETSTTIVITAHNSSDPKAKMTSYRVVPKPSWTNIKYGDQVTVSATYVTHKGVQYRRTTCPVVSYRKTPLSQVNPQRLKKPTP